MVAMGFTLRSENGLARRAGVRWRQGSLVKCSSEDPGAVQQGERQGQCSLKIYCELGILTTDCPTP